MNNSSFKITERTISIEAGDLSAVVSVGVEGMARTVRFSVSDSAGGKIGVTLDAERIDRIAAVLEALRRDEGLYGVEVCPAHGYWRRGAYTPTGRAEIDDRLGFLAAMASAADRCPGCYPPAPQTPPAHPEGCECSDHVAERDAAPVTTEE